MVLITKEYIIYIPCYYIDTAPPFGIRTAAMFCQRTTSAIAHIAHKHNFDLLPYIDDIAGICPSETEAERG